MRAPPKRLRAGPRLRVATGVCFAPSGKFAEPPPAASAGSSTSFAPGEAARPPGLRARASV
eukprot:11200303-Lingulodinium_polyedra.AAC.1